MRLCLYVSVVLGYTLNFVIRQWTVSVTSVH